MSDYTAYDEYTGRITNVFVNQEKEKLATKYVVDGIFSGKQYWVNVDTGYIANVVFNFDGSANGFTGSGCVVTASKYGNLQQTDIQGTNPYIQSGTISVNGSSNTKVHMKVKRTGDSSAWEGYCLYTTPANTSFSFDQYKHIAFGNLISFEKDIANTYWIKTNSTITPNDIAAPDGTVTADKLCGGNPGTSTTHSITGGGMPDVKENTIYTLSAHFKASELKNVQIHFRRRDNTTAVCRFDLETGAQSQKQNILGCDFQNIGNDWIRASISFDTLSGATIPFVYFYLVNNSGVTTYNATTPDGLYIWGIQLDEGMVMLPYPRVEKDKWYVLEWDMSNLTAGGTDFVTSTITKIRFDLGDQDPDSTWEIDWIAMGENDPSQPLRGLQVLERLPLPEPSTLLIQNNGIDTAKFTKLPNPSYISYGVDWDGVDDATMTITDGSANLKATVIGNFDIRVTTEDPKYQDAQYVLVVTDSPIINCLKISSKGKSITISKAANITIDKCIFTVTGGLHTTDDAVDIPVTKLVCSLTFPSIIVAVSKSIQINTLAIRADGKEVLLGPATFIPVSVMRLSNIGKDISINIGETNVIDITKGLFTFTMPGILVSAPKSVSITKATYTVTFKPIT